MKFLSSEQIKKLKKKYPVGSIVKCINMTDPYHPIPSGTTGTVTDIDSAGTIHVNWDNGSTLGLIPEEDEFEIINKPKSKGLSR